MHLVSLIMVEGVRLDKRHFEFSQFVFLKAHKVCCYRDMQFNGNSANIRLYKLLQNCSMGLWQNILLSLRQ